MVFSQKDIAAGKLKKTPAVVVEEKKIVAKKEGEKKDAKKETLPDDPWFVFQHPECTASFRPNCTMNLLGESITVENGRIETQNTSVRDELKRQGWRWMNEEY